MNDYKKYFLRQLGLKESQFVPFVREDEHPDIDPEAQMVSPTAKPTPIIAVGIRGSVTGGLPSSADQKTPDLAPTKLGGYDRVTPEDLNTKLINKTPENPEIDQDCNPINQNPHTGQGVTHPHQIQVTAGEEPQQTTGASTDSDPTLTLKSAQPKGIDIDIAETEDEPSKEEENPMIPVTSLGESLDQTFARHRKMALDICRQHAATITEGKHKAGCECGFCKNKSSFGKKKDVEEGDEADAMDDQDQELHSDKEKHNKQWRKDRANSDAGKEVQKYFEKDKKKKDVEECATCGCGDPSDTHGHGTPKEKDESLDENKKPRICYHCKQPHPCKCDKKDEEDSKLQRDDPEKYRKQFGTKVDRRSDLNESYSPPFSRMRGLAGLGKVVLSSNGHWTDTTIQEENHPPGADHPFVTHWKMDKEKAGYVKVDEDKLKNVKAQLDRKSKRGTLSDKELQLAKRLDEVLKKRQMIKESKTRGNCPACTYHSNALDVSTGLCPQCM